MTKQLPPDLYAQRPVRSDFARHGGRGLNIRKVTFLLILLLFIAGAGYSLSLMSESETNEPEGTPTIQADMPLKERPDQPGGIEIPHQDVAVFQQLDTPLEDDGLSSKEVEHLLPAPQEPEGIEASSTESSFETGAADDMPSAITAASPEDIQETTNAASEMTAAPSTTTEPNTTSAVSGKIIANETTTAQKAVAETPKKPTPTTVDKTTKKKAIDTTEGKKTEVAITRLPKELFTNDPDSTGSDSSSLAQSAGKGVYKVQIASFTNRTAAEDGVKKFEKKYSSLFSGTSLVITKADLGSKGIYYRVTTPTFDEKTARTLCSDIKKQKGSCLVTK